MMPYIKALTAGIAMCGILYLGGAFSAATFNIQYWSEAQRGGVAYFGLLLGVAAFCGVLATENLYEKEK